MQMALLQKSFLFEFKVTIVAARPALLLSRMFIIVSSLAGLY